MFTMVERFVDVVEGNQSVVEICVDLMGESLIETTVVIANCSDPTLSTGRDEAKGELLVLCVDYVHMCVLMYICVCVLTVCTYSMYT